MHWLTSRLTLPTAITPSHSPIATTLKTKRVITLIPTVITLMVKITKASMITVMPRTQLITVMPATITPETMPTPIAAIILIPRTTKVLTAMTTAMLSLLTMHKLTMTLPTLKPTPTCPPTLKLCQTTSLTLLCTAL